MKYLVAAAVAASLLAGTAATAEPYGRNNSQWDNNRGNGQWDNNRGDGRWNNNGNHNGWYKNRNHPRWSRGDRFRDYGRRGWVVNDYRSYRLNRPPRGYHWVQADDDYLLVAIASGVIAQIVLNNSSRRY